MKEHECKSVNGGENVICAGYDCKISLRLCAYVCVCMCVCVHICACVPLYQFALKEYLYEIFLLI